MTQQLIPGFVVVHSHRLEDLTAVATQFMARYPLAPLQAETVLVQSNGIAQWLKINLAQLNGIAAMLNVSLPARFVWQAYRAVLGDDIPKTSPFDKDRLAWRIMRLLPGLVAGGQNGWITGAMAATGWITRRCRCRPAIYGRPNCGGHWCRILA